MIREALETNPELLDIFYLADYLKSPLSVIRSMPLVEFQGWLEFLKIKAG